MSFRDYSEDGRVGCRLCRKSVKDRGESSQRWLASHLQGAGHLKAVRNRKYQGAGGLMQQPPKGDPT